MASIRQIEANRRNAQKSTGPKTPEGKANIRFNALQHGLTARAAVLPFEDPAEFAQLCAGLEEEWRPQTSTESYHLEVMAVSRWKQARAERMLQKVCRSFEPSPAEFQTIEQLQKQQARLQRAHDKAQRELQALQKVRNSRPHPVLAAVDRDVDRFVHGEPIGGELTRVLAEHKLRVAARQQAAAEAAAKMKNQSQSAPPPSAPQPPSRNGRQQPTGQ